MFETLLPLTLFLLAMSITPGPNNIMLTASGINFGFARTIPHIIGITLGMIILMLLSALGLGSLFTLFPVLKTILKIAGSVYLVYFAFRIATAKRSDKTVETKSRPFTIWEAVIFQFLNPKAVLICVTTIATYSKDGDLFIPSIVMILSVMFFCCIIAISVWAGFGTLIGRVLKSDFVFRACNIGLGTLTALSVVMIIH